MSVSSRLIAALCLALLAAPSLAARDTVFGQESGPNLATLWLAQAQTETPGEVAAEAAARAPALAMGLNGIHDWSPQQPFLDIFKTSRPWIGHLPGQWGGIETDVLRAGGHIDARGWPLSIPDEAERIEALVLTDRPEEAQELRGAYVLTYEGEGEISVTGLARRVDAAPGRIRFFYEPGPGAVGVSIAALNEDNPIREIRLFREEHEPLLEAGALFNPAWLARIADMRVLRFMDWMETNNSPVTDWDSRPRVEDATYAAWGVPLPVLLRLANEVGADPWFTLPHMADDAYVRAFAESVRDGLDPRLKAYAEYSNEMWNDIFEQARWADRQAEELWGPGDDLRMQFYGKRAAEVMDIWADVFDDAAEARLVRVFATHTGWAGREARALAAPLAFLTLGKMPQDSFDAYAVTGYFLFDFEAQGDALLADLDDAEAAAQEAGEAQGLARVALREHVRETRFNEAFAPFAERLEPNVARLTDEVFPYHAQAAEQAGLDLIMYEGGAHLVPAGHPEAERLAEFLSAFGYSDAMAGLYDQLLSGWSAAGGTLFNAFVDMGRPSQWGIWGHLRHPWDDNPRWQSLLSYNDAAPVPDARGAAVFANGAVAAGTNGDDEIRGSGEEDLILAGPGDDLVISGGGADLLHGGAGEDEARLPGVQSDWTISRDAAGRTLVQSGWLIVRLTDFELLSFEGTTGETISLP
ncbi:hypothetical protein SAMN05421853_10723 [Roseivivax halotolerans]|uniref:Hemolysin-type calcium-binding repeat-containing protein n=1 Tax=Roseivivax halotolerans TaxID=93684 RepID=A0A1I5YXB1_9RHOB|nr:hypothetical protein [Roseivivax halotolerans]SFQ48876.1 hypothetical protein SAMN05421853_10723 [Roseivivax halotolerans]